MLHELERTEESETRDTVKVLDMLAHTADGGDKLVVDDYIASLLLGLVMESGKGFALMAEADALHNSRR